MGYEGVCFHKPFYPLVGDEMISNKQINRETIKP